MRPNDKLLELEDDDVPPFDQEWWGSRDPEVERAFDAACLALSRARRREDKLLALGSGVEALKKFDDYGTAIRDLGARAVTYGLRLADIKSIVGQDFEDPPPAPSSLPHDEDDVSSELKLRLGITSQLGAYLLRHPAAIEQLRVNGFRPEYLGCDHAFFGDLFGITRLPADQWNRGLAELQRKYPAEHSRYLRLGEHLPALSSDELAEYFIPLAGIIQPNPAPVETDDEDNRIDPIREIATLAEQIRSRTEEPPPPPAATDVVAILPPVPPAVLDVVEEAPPESPASAAPTSPAPAGVIIDEEAPPPPTQPVVKMEQQPSVPYIGAARTAEIEAANLEAMLKLASAGVPVFPARLDWNAEAKKWDKQPAITGWKKAATTDPDIIRRWWRDLPRKLGLPAYRLVPGIWCGHPALDLVVVDADRHGGPDGVSALNALVAEPGNELPAGPRTLTAGSGVHYVFRQPPGKTKFGNSKGELPGGIDIRGVDGWIVGPGAMRPDGKMWRGAGDASSLTDAFRAGSIPTIPTWLVDLIRAPKPDKPEKAPKAKIQTKAAKPAPSTAPPSSDKTGTKREKAWARGALNKIVEKLAAMPPNSGRNEYLYRKAFFMGTTACRGLIDRRSVESEMYSACEKNGLVAEGDDVRGAIERGLNDGSGCPHEDLPDRRTKAARQQRDSTTAWKNLLPTEIYRLLRVRPGGEFATDDAAKDVLAAIRREGHVIDNLDRRKLGDLLGATFKEWKAIGAMFDRHPSRFLPYDATQEEVDAHLLTVRKAKNPDRAKAARERRAHEKLRREHQPPTNELVAQRCAALVAFAKKHPGKHKTGDLVRGLKRWDAFDGLLTDQVRRNTIVELLRLAVSGKLDALTKFLIVTKETARNRKPTFTVEHCK
jgi:Bifunctional DNA primase/polymerase, N-terminal